MRVKVSLAHPNRRDRGVEVEDALVDTGTTLTTIPRRVATDLGLEIVGQNRVRTASGMETVDRSSAWIELEGKDGFIQVSVTDTYPGVLIGVITLETLGFAVDPKGERLVDAELLLL